MKSTTSQRAESATATLWRCGGRQCPPGTCDHDGEIRRHADVTGPETAPAIVHDVLSTAGTPLPTGLRRDMEERFGHDFAAVRVHTGDRAAVSARAVSANAYTVGRDVVFGAGVFPPGTTAGRRVLAHELAHTVQHRDGPGIARSALPISAPDDPAERAADRAADLAMAHTSAGATPPEASSTRSNEFERKERQTRTVRAASRPVLHRDFAIAPPRPAAEGRVLTAPQMQAAIAFNNTVVTVVGPAGIGELRDVLGISALPQVVDEDFVNAVVDWQAQNRLTQDGRLGPATARPLFREIGAEGAGRAELVSDPSYAPTGTIAPPVDGAGDQFANFRLRAEFRNDPANGIYASCGEIRQFIMWDAASATAMGGPPHAGFPGGTAAGTWVEDRDDTGNNRYGHRAGPFSDPQNFDQYLDTTGVRNQAFGHRYRGSDRPGGAATGLGGTWRFLIRAVDVCHGGAQVGAQDFVRVNW